jgi:dihydroxy-acid dehydratase
LDRGPIALVEDGDVIAIDIPARTLNIVGSKEGRLNSNEVQALLAARKKSWTPVVRQHPPGFLNDIPPWRYRPLKERIWNDKAGSWEVGRLGRGEGGKLVS